MRRVGFPCAALLVAILGSPSAHADEAPTPPPAPLPAPVPPAPVDAKPADGNDWGSRFRLARERLLAGDFKTAAEMFAELAASAPTESDRAVAQELGALSLAWTKKGVVFVRREDIGESTVHAKAADERTTDELAVLYTTSVFYGIGSGIFLGTLTEPKSPAAGILPTLGLIGVSVGAVFLADGGTSGRPLRYGVAQSIAVGATLGFYEGMLWSLWNVSRARHGEEWGSKTVTGLMWASATAGAVAGGAIGSAVGTTPGRAAFVGSAGFWGGLTVGMVAAALDSDMGDTRDDSFFLGAALGLNAGVLIGALNAGSVAPRVARVRFLDLGGLGGAILFGGLYLAAAGKDADGRAALGVLAAGQVCGLSVAWFATSGMDPDRTERDDPKKSVIFYPTVSPRKGGATVGLGATF